jgi:hypothetical protein
MPEELGRFRLAEIGRANQQRSKVCSQYAPVKVLPPKKSETSCGREWTHAEVA